MRKLLLVAIAVTASLAVSLPASAHGYSGPPEHPRINAPNAPVPFTTFHVRLPKHNGADDTHGYELSLWSDGVLIGRAFTSNPAGIEETIAVRTFPTPSCHYQADMRVFNPVSGLYRPYSATVKTFPLADCAT